MARGPRITDKERKLMLQLDSEGWTQTRIANHTGRHIETVRNVLVAIRGPKIKNRRNQRTKEEIAVQKARFVVNNLGEPVPTLTPTVGFEILRLLVQMADLNPDASLETIELVVDLFTNRLKTRMTDLRRKQMKCLAVQAQAIYASTLRACGRVEEARAEIELLIEENQACLECQEDLTRRLVYILISMNQLELAEKFALSSLDLCSTISNTGHDLDRLPRSKCHAALCTVYYHNNQFDLSLSTAFEAAKGVDPKNHEIHYQQCLTLIAYSCVHLNQLQDASKYVSRLVDSHPPDEVSVPAARTLWLSGVLAYLEARPKQGLFLFEQALDYFKDLNLENDVIACAMDHALLSGKTPEQIKKSILMISEFNEDRGRKEFPDWISQPLKLVMHRLYQLVSSRSRKLSPIHIIRQTVREIRDFVGGEDLMPVIS